MSEATEKSVLVSYLHPNVVSHNMMDSLWNVMEYDRENENLLFKRFPVRSGPVSLDKSRNIQAQVFRDQTTCEWLWIIDSDMGFKKDTLAKLVASADKDSRPIVSALYYGMIEEETDEMGGWKHRIIPIYYQADEEGTFQEVPRVSVRKNSLIRVAGIGAGCTLIHRSVVEKMGEAFSDNWFTFMDGGPVGRLGEDLSFSRRAGLLDIPIWVDSRIIATHHKATWIGQ